ncbi:NUMOD3 domain-containing DNA-binding protein [Clostridium baratii]|uniref:Group I intron endonuclease n=1 Tax=Clostridium baratii TaxID=1561 RepID=A0A174QMZ3_9CLOT|nr:NUMOD3 domain-containing DNA-binding protein [Clostridium baratii]CUP74613.1 group I intron endonuclease [Clostridium baratii]
MIYIKIGNLEVYGIIYLIKNTFNGKCYVGQSTRTFNKRYDRKGKGIERVYNYHIARKNDNSYYNKHLLNSIEKYGQTNFKVIEIYDIAFSKTELDIKESTYIQLFNSYKNGYNETLGGQYNCIFYGENNGFYGKKHSEEAKSKMSESKKGCIPWNKGKNVGNFKSKSVICLTTGLIFGSAKEGAEYYDIPKTGVTANCRGVRKSAGKFEGKKLVWEWYEKDNTEVTNSLKAS